MAKRPRKVIADHWRTLQRVYWRPLAQVLVIIYAAAAAFYLLSDQFASARLQRDLRLGDHVPRLSAWEWLAIGLGLLLVLGFEGAVKEVRRLEDASSSELAIQQRKHEAALKIEQDAHQAERDAHMRTRGRLQDEQGQPVSHEHRDRLIRIAQRVSAMVSSERACQYFDGALRGLDAKKAFASHFPDDAAVLDRWDAATEERDAAVGALIARIHADITESMDLPPWHAEPISSAFQLYIQQCAQIAGSGTPWPSLNLVIEDGMGRWTLPMPGSMGAYVFCIFDTGEIDGDAGTYQVEFEKWFEQIRVSGEFDRLRTAWQAVRDQKLAALEAARKVEQRDEIYRRCSACEHP